MRLVNKQSKLLEIATAFRINIIAGHEVAAPPDENSLLRRSRRDARFVPPILAGCTRCGFVRTLWMDVSVATCVLRRFRGERVPRHGVLRRRHSRATFTGGLIAREYYVFLYKVYGRLMQMLFGEQAFFTAGNFNKLRYSSDATRNVFSCEYISR